MPKKGWSKKTVKPRPKKPTKSKVWIQRRNSHVAGGILTTLSTVVGSVNKVVAEYGTGSMFKRKRRGH